MNKIETPILKESGPVGPVKNSGWSHSSLQEDSKLVMNSTGYITNGCCASDDLQSLREHPTIQMFASMDEDLQNLVKQTNPTLFLFVTLARKIMNGGVGGGSE